MISQIINESIKELPNPHQFSLFEKILIQHNIDELNIKSLIQCFPSFNDKEKFQLIRLSLLKRDQAFLYEKLIKQVKTELTKEQFRALEQIKQELHEQDLENQKLKKRIIEAVQNPKPSKDELEKEIRRKIEQYTDKLLEIHERSIYRGVPGVKYISGTDKIIVIIDEIPDIIFKFDSQVPSFENARKVCQETNLPNLRVPVAVYVDQLKDKKISFTAMEKLKVLTDYSDFDERLRFMNKDPDLQKIANDFYRQLAVFIAKTGLTDTKPWNVPFMEDGLGFALIDLDIQNKHLSSGLYTFQDEKNLISHVEECNMETIANVAKEMDPKFFTEDKIKGFEANRRKELAFLKKYREHQIQRGVVKSSDPIVLDPGEFEGLSSSEISMVNNAIGYINEKLIKKDFYDIPRRIKMDNFEYYDPILDHLLTKKVIFKVDRIPYYYNTRARIIYC